MDYTHKSVLFTKENYKGDALVMMYPIKGEEKNLFYLNDLKYRTNEEVNFLSYQGVCRSLIVEKGGVQLGGKSDGHGYPGEYAQDSNVLSDNQPIETVFFPDVSTSPPNDILLECEPVQQKYFLTFYPKLNAYFISPAPLCEFKNGKFRWVLHDDDTFTIDWNDEDKIEYAY